MTSKSLRAVQRMSILAVAVAICLCWKQAPLAWADTTDVAPSLQKRLANGELKEADSDLTKLLQESPQHAQARFALGMVRVLQSLEGFVQDQHRYGAALRTGFGLPLLRLPIPANANPEEIRYEQVRLLVQRLQEGLLRAEIELAQAPLDGDIRLPVDLAQVRMDFDGDGAVGKDEHFLVLFGAVNRIGDNQQQQFEVTFDQGDVLWLRGYCHFLCAVCDMFLAYDHQQAFDVCAQTIYPRHISSQALEAKLDLGAPDSRSDAFIMDVIAAIHLASFPLKEPDRMKSAHAHLLEMIRTSRGSWKQIRAETDDDHEWLPNPQQTGALQVPVTSEMIDGWHAVLAEMEEILEGRKLIPFWRDYVRLFGPSNPVPQEGRGINARRIFFEPREFDLVLTLQGSAVLPYLEEGTLSHPETWTQLSNVFRGNFFGFAAWFN